MRTLIFGAGGHGQVIADILLESFKYKNAEYKPIGFLDDNDSLWEKSFLGLPVIGSLEQASNIEYDAVIVAIGSNHIRQKITRHFEAINKNFASAIHPSSIIGRNVAVGYGVMICAGVIINTGSCIGNHTILNTGCSVDHHNQIENYVHIAPGSHLGGDVSIGEGTLVGIGATVLPQKKIGQWSVVGAGAVVNRDVSDWSTVVGIPALPILTSKSLQEKVR